MDLANKVAIVTGAGSGIGRETALELSRCGCTCVLVGRTEDKLRQVLDLVLEHAPDSTVEICDVSDETQVKQAVLAVNERYGHIDVLVNSAGIMIVKPFADLTGEEFDAHMSINYNGAVYFVRAVLPVMQGGGQGVIVNVASVGGKLNLPGLTANTASKAALYAFSESLYYDLKDGGIHVAVVLPGGTRTDLFDNVNNRLGEYYRDQSTMPPARVAAKIREAIEKERFETVVPFANRLHIAFHDTFPCLFHKLIRRRLRPYV
ncbi:MAG: SDR family NAD(P)-dependent oxidoreductase [Dehalococcoidia bacterium]|nr:MAG: SDR family NAD(P)-dependent oxidoreductase [Dehalococcoidia bacterium]